MSKRLMAAVCCLFLSGCASIVIDNPNGPQPPAPVPVQVPFQIEITKSVYGRSASVNGMAINLSGFSSSIKAGSQNTEILTGNVPLQPGSYTLTVSGTYDQWNGQSSPISATSNFTVTAKPTVSLTVSPSSGGILVARNGASVPLNFAIARTNSTAQVDITAPDLPTGVTLPTVSIPSISTSDVANLSAGPIANGQANVHFTAKMTGADNAVQVVSVRVVPVAGTIAWVAAPFLGGGGPATPTSPDGRFKVTATRSGAQRVWTLHIVATSAPSGIPPKSIDVIAAQWGGVGGSDLAGIAFCPSTTLTTLSALVISDVDENTDVTFHPASVTYHLKVIRFDGGTPRLQGTIENIYYRGGVLPRLAFSPDCSIVGAWTTDSTGSNARTVTFLDIFNGQSTTPFSFMDTTTPPSASQPSASLAAISSANINLTPPNGMVQTKPVP